MGTLTSTGDRVERVNLADLMGLGPDVWDRLVARSATPNPFMSWAWHEAWRTASNAVDVAASEVIVLRSAGGDVQALLPFRIRRTRFRRAVVTALGWAMGDLGCPDHLDVLASPDADLSLLVPQLEALPWDVILLDNVAGDAPNTNRLCAACARRGWIVRRIPLWDCPYLELPESWAAYLSRLSPTRRQVVGRKERKLRREHHVAVTDYGSEQLDEGWRQLRRLHGLRWAGAGVFQDLAMDKLHRAFSSWLAQRRALWLTTLDVDGTPAAAWYGFSSGRTVYFYQGGWDPSWDRHSVGGILMGVMIRRAIEQGYRLFDFLRGDEPYKTAWAETARPCYQIAIIRTGWRGAVLRGLDWIATHRGGTRLRSLTRASRPYEEPADG